jgi:hypothetical protein
MRSCGNRAVCDRVNKGTGAGHLVGAVVWFALGGVVRCDVCHVNCETVATLCSCARACVCVFVMIHLK